EKFPLLCLSLVGFFALWTLWAWLLARYPGMDPSGVIRAAVRLLIWVVPALLFVRLVEGGCVLLRLGLCDKSCRGLVIGLGGFAVLLLATVLRQRSGRFSFAVPTELAIWLNPILTAPLAEELVFRGLAFRVLRDRFNVAAALVASSLLFALIHLPYWWMSGSKTPGAIGLSLVTMTAYGLLFAFLYQWSGSLWSPLICHWLNNLMT